MEKRVLKIISGLIFTITFATLVTSLDESCSYRKVLTVRTDSQYALFPVQYRYCLNGCCGTFNYRYCCSASFDEFTTTTTGPVASLSTISTTAVIGIVVGCLLAIAVIVTVAIVICCVCCNKKSPGHTGMVFNSPQQGTHVTHVANNETGYSQPYYPQQQYVVPPPYPLQQSHTGFPSIDGVTSYAGQYPGHRGHMDMQHPGHPGHV